MAPLCLASNIARRAGSANYYARLGVPKDLQAVVGKKELWESLRTKDAREAKARVHAVLNRWHAEFDALRRRRAVSEMDLQVATWAHYKSELEHHHQERQQHPTAQELEAERVKIAEKVEAKELPWGDDPLSQVSAAVELLVRKDSARLASRFRAGRKKTLEEHLGRGETALVHDVADALIAREGFAIEPGSPAYRDLCQRLQRAELEALRRADEQDQGDFTGRSADPLVQAPSTIETARVAAPGEGVLDLFDVFARENPKGVKPDTIRMNREIVTWFAQYVGVTFPASAIDKRAVREWKQALSKFPIKAAEVRELRGLSFKKIITENERLKRPTLSDRTINKYLSALGAYCQWLMQNGHIENNPVDGMHLGKGRGPSKVRPYSVGQLTAIFTSPLFTGCAGDDAPHRPGGLRVRDHRYWLPLLSLFTGARMGELAQLLAADVRQEHGRWIIHVTREGDAEKTTKTKGSQRVIPIHPELERLGFLTFHAQCVAVGDKRLFPEIKPDARGQLTGHYSRFYGRYVARIGVKDDASVNFHSFRHGMADALRRAGFRDEEFGFLLGHTQATTTGRYGILAEGDLAQRCRMIDAVTFPGLDLSHLHQAPTHSSATRNAPLDQAENSNKIVN